MENNVGVTVAQEIELCHLLSGAVAESDCGCPKDYIDIDRTGTLAAEWGGSIPVSPKIRAVDD